MTTQGFMKIYAGDSSLKHDNIVIPRVVILIA